MKTLIKVPAEKIIKACQQKIPCVTKEESNHLYCVMDMAEYALYSEYPYLMLSQEDYYILKDYL